jgi:hypothetical protein
MLGKESIGYNITAGCEKLIGFISIQIKNKNYKKQQLLKNNYLLN